MNEDDVVLAYHERTKHHPYRFAAALPYLDWATQPDPFRRYAGAPLVKLELPGTGRALPYFRLFEPDAVPAAPLSMESLSLFFRYSLSLTAWKKIETSTWSLRANPSSGNLHPTEGYAILPAVDGVALAPGVFHYAPREHALELRATLKEAPVPDGAFLAGLTSIHWREAWKYGERAFRYCQHDLGHALAAMRVAAAALGWRLLLLEGLRDSVIPDLLGIGRDEDFGDAEREEPEILAIVSPGPAPGATLRALPAADWRGRANVLSAEHSADWPVIEEAARATRRAARAPLAEGLHGFPTAEALFGAPVRASRLTAERAILERRSAVAMDRETSIPRETFFRMLARLVPTRDGRAMPWDAIPWRPRVHLALFVHRVDGLAPGLYALPRDPEKLEPMRRATRRKEFAWRGVPSSPPGLPLRLLEERDCRSLAAAVSCGQDIAGDGAFSLGMIAELGESLAAFGPAFYRNLHWEAGVVGQVLYLEAVEAGIGSTGIGCFFDDSVHAVFGIDSTGWQSLYHFTVGGPVEDTRLTTLPGYGPR